MNTIAYWLAYAAQDAAAAPRDTSLTTGGWIFMVLSVGFVTILCGWCFYRVLTTPYEPSKEVEDFHSA